VRARHAGLSQNLEKRRMRGRAPAREQWPARLGDGRDHPGKARPDKGGRGGGAGKGRARETVPASPILRFFPENRSTSRGAYFFGRPRFPKIWTLEVRR
jgi:hypothetical protein